MSQTLLQFILTVLMYTLMGCVVGVGIVLVKKYPKIGDFIYQRPILGWTLAFGAGSVVLTVLMMLTDTLLILLLRELLR